MIVTADLCVISFMLLAYVCCIELIFFHSRQNNECLGFHMDLLCLTDKFARYNMNTIVSYYCIHRKTLMTLASH